MDILSVIAGGLAGASAAFGYVRYKFDMMDERIRGSNAELELKFQKDLTRTKENLHEEIKKMMQELDSKIRILEEAKKIVELKKFRDKKYN